jgi:hypothetical protein
MNTTHSVGFEPVRAVGSLLSGLTVPWWITGGWAPDRGKQHRRCPALQRPPAQPTTANDHELLANDFAEALAPRGGWPGVAGPLR